MRACLDGRGIVAVEKLFDGTTSMMVQSTLCGKVNRDQDGFLDTSQAPLLRDIEEFEISQT